jgi:hypothetical protein
MCTVVLPVYCLPVPGYPYSCTGIIRFPLLFSVLCSDVLVIIKYIYGWFLDQVPR